MGNRKNEILQKELRGLGSNIRKGYTKIFTNVGNNIWKKVCKLIMNDSKTIQSVTRSTTSIL